MVTAFSILICVIWLLVFSDILASRRHHLPKIADSLNEKIPSEMLSIIIPFRNERQAIGETVSSLLNQTYKNFELICVDDQSDDGGGEIVDRLASSDQRVRCIRVEAVPSGWLGKVNAMKVGLEKSRGNVILFSDADVCHFPHSLQNILSFFESRNLDHLAVAPRVISRNFIEAILHSTFWMIMFIFLRLWKINKPGSKQALGIGAFNMVRRAALNATDNLRLLKLEVVDDIGLASLIKKAGLRSMVAIGHSEMEMDYLSGPKNFLAGLRKNIFAGFGYKVRTVVGSMLLAIIFFCSPYILLTLSRSPATFLLNLGSLFLFGFVFYWGLHRVYRFWVAYFFPVGLMFFAVATIQSTYISLRDGGVRWRDRFYPLELLRSEMAYKR